MSKQELHVNVTVEASSDSAAHLQLEFETALHKCDELVVSWWDAAPRHRARIAERHREAVEERDRLWKALVAAWETEYKPKAVMQIGYEAPHAVIDAIKRFSDD